MYNFIYYYCYINFINMLSLLVLFKLLKTNIGISLVLKIVTRVFPLNKMIENNIKFLMDKKNSGVSNENFDVINDKNHTKIMYEINGRRYKLFLPFNRNKKISSINKLITVEHPDGKKEVIDHPPGIPFLIKPKDIGNDVKINVDDLINGESIIYMGEEIPKL